MAEKTDKGGELYVYGEMDYRYGIKDNPDVEGCLDFFYDEWNTETKTWKRHTSFECVPAETLYALAKGAALLTKWEAEEFYFRPEEVLVRGGSLSFEQCKQACQNIGIDLNCEACAAVFYTGASQAPHTCQKEDPGNG